MQIRNLDDCFRLRLIRRIKPNKEKSEMSLNIAEKRLKQGHLALEHDFFQYVVLEAYMAMFHASRALLYRDGIQEKSHFAIYVYLKEKYGDEIPLNVLNLLNIHRIERHEAMYSLEYKPGRDDAMTALEDAEIYIKEIKNVLK
ncbi:MAG: HEPN domain-containing protein [Candidatus Aenigmarchaeota archaeon]|nr:HEPN domain-containing protein [Candidatus Aenigmarchaeota archaeon]